MKFLALFLSALSLATAVPVRSMRSMRRDALRAFPEAGISINTAGWEVLGAANPEAVIPIWIGLPDRNRETIDKIFREVSDPSHRNYGKYLSSDEITAIVKPDPEHAEKVSNWATSFGAGVKSLRPVGHGDYLRLDVTVATAEDMFAVELREMRHIGSGAVLVRTPEVYSVPGELQSHIVFVDGLHRLPIDPKPIAAKAAGKSKATVSDAGNWPNYCGATCADMITPPVLRQRYNITRNATSGKSKVAVAEFQGQDSVPSDLARYQQICGLPNKPLSKIVGPDNGAAGVEASLDVDVIAGVSPGVDLWFWGVASYDLLAWIEAVAANDESPHVHSVSYGNDQKDNSKDMMSKVDADFQRVAVSGRTIVVASGDQGAWGRTGVFDFHTSWPTVSPYVTSVGATQFPGSSITHETCTTWSGGGFATELFEAQSYQTDAIKAYFASSVKMPSAHLYNAKGRGFPDVSTNGGGNQRYCVTASGAEEGVAGTSASCPLFAAMVGLLNDIRFAQGKSPLGFMNPLLYQHPELFDDITTGDNNNGHFPIDEGWRATTGWDPCSGLGNPNFEKWATFVAGEKLA